MAAGDEGVQPCGPGGIHVLQVCTRLNVGGPARHLDALARHLPEEFCTEVAAGPSPEDEGHLPVGAPTLDVPLQRSLHPGRDVQALRVLRRLIAARRPAIVATHMAKAGVAGRLAAFRSPHRPVTVHTYHGHLLEGYFSRPARRAVVAVERALARHTDALVAVSPAVRDALLAAGVGRSEQWHVLPLAVDLAPLAAGSPRGCLRAAIGVPDGAPLVGAVGRLAPVKDLGVLLHALVHLPGVHLALVGDGPSRPSLAAEADRLGISDRVHLPGWWAEVGEVYADLDVVALTSRNEGTPSALIEAAAAGRPVVATDVGGVGGLLGDGRRGTLVPAGDVAATAGALQAVLDDPEGAARRAAAARAYALDRHSAPGAAAAHAALYRRLLGRPGPPA